MAKLKVKVIIIITALTALCATPALASDISTALYEATIRITNNSTALVNNAYTVFSLSTEDLVNNNYIQSDVTDTAIRTNTAADVNYGPAADNNTLWSVHVPSILGKGIYDYKMFIGGGSDMGAPLSYSPGPTGMTVPDDASLELGDNFTISQSGLFDATNSGNLTNKTSAFTLKGDGSGNITAIIRDGVTQESYVINDDSNEDYFGAEWHSQTFTNNNAYTITAIKILIYRVGSPGTITASIRETAAGKPTGADLTSGTHDGDTLTTNTAGEWITITLSPIVLDDATQYAMVLRATSGDGGNTVNWRMDASSPSYAGGSRIKSSNSGGAWTIFVADDFMFETISDLTVTASGITTGLILREASANTSHFWISIDGVNTANTTLSGASVTDNSENWVIAESAVVPFMGSTNITIDGVLAGSWQWENAITFSDLSANSNNATPTFRTATSNANVTAQLVSFAPVTFAVAANFSTSSFGPMITLAPTQPTGAFTEDPSGLPGAQAITDIFATSDTPVSLFWFTLSFGAAVIIGLASFGVTRSMLAEYMIILFIISGFAVGGAVPVWSPFIFGINGAAIMLASSKFGW